MLPQGNARRAALDSGAEASSPEIEEPAPAAGPPSAVAAPRRSTPDLRRPPPEPRRRVAKAAAWVPAGLSQVPGFLRGHTLVIGAILLAALAIGGYFVLSTRTTSVAVTMPTAPASSPPTTGSPSARPEAGPPIQVHVLGAVVRPGVVRLRAGARVHDALAAAGGLLPQADPGALNLAGVLSDGSQILIGTKGSPRGEVNQSGTPTLGGGTPAGQRLDLNSAVEKELEQLPGIGPVTAKKIVDWRVQHGRFAAVEQLQEVPGIGPKTFSELAPYVRV